MEKKMNGKWLPHIIAVGAFVVFIVLGLACATTPKNWKDVILNGEDSKLLEGNVYAMIASNDAVGSIPTQFSFLPNGKADVSNSFSKSTWERKGSDVKLVLDGGWALVEGTHNTESNTISGTITYSDDSKAEFTMVFLGPTGSRIDYMAALFSIRSYGLMIMVGDSFVTMADLTGYTGTNTNIRLPPVKDGLMITNIAARAFYNKNLTNVFFPKRNISTIQAQAFANNKLTTLILPANIVSIGNQAFANNPLIYIIIGANVDFLGMQFGTEQGSLLNSGFEDTSSLPIGYNFEKTYIDGGRKAGTYTRPNTSSTTWTKQPADFPSGFIGTWKRDNFNNTLTFTTDTLKPSNQTSFRILSGVYGDSYTYYQNNSPSWIHTLTIKLVNDNLVISGDSGSGNGEDNWDGTWKKIN